MSYPLYLGIMTGTSLDAIDIAICSFESGRVGLAGFHSSAWPKALRDILFEFATAQDVTIDLLARTNFILSQYYAQAVSEAIASSGLTAADIRAIGLHGQTIRHLPIPESVQGLIPTGATIQWGSGSALAALTGIDVVSDFRSADIALGGQGAPLVPMFDYAFLGSDTADRLITNVGGISNVTWIPAGANADDVIAFDCGPGNMMIDTLAMRYFGEPFDKNGDHARQGQVSEELLSQMLAHEYFHQAPPKSTGRELFGDRFLKQVVNKVDANELSAEDALATITELTARSISDALRLIGAGPGSEIYISGGGALNTFLLERIRANAPDSLVHTSTALSIPPDAKEAIAFAFFAKAFLENIVIHLPRTTGATHSVILGSLSKGRTE